MILNRFLFLTAIPLMLFSCSTKLDNATAFDQVMSKTTFSDTTLYYKLYSDSLVLEYKELPEVKYWRGEVFLLATDKVINVHFPGNLKGFLGKLEFVKNRAVLDGFHIPSDSLDFFRIKLRASPVYLGCHSYGAMYGPAVLFQSDSTEPNRLKVNEGIKNWEITHFDLVKMKNLPKEQREFCQDSIQQLSGIRITDVEIAESSYDW